MTEKKQKVTESLGTTLHGVSHVVRPDGSEHEISGGSYVLDVSGLHVVDGVEVYAK